MSHRMTSRRWALLERQRTRSCFRSVALRDSGARQRCWDVAVGDVPWYERTFRRGSLVRAAQSNTRFEQLLGRLGL